MSSSSDILSMALSRALFLTKVNKLEKPKFLGGCYPIEDLLLLLFVRSSVLSDFGSTSLLETAEFLNTLCSCDDFLLLVESILPSTFTLFKSRLSLTLLLT